MPNCSEGAFGPSTAGSQRTAGSLKMDSSLLVLVIAFRSMRLLGVSIPLDPRRARKTLTVKGSPQEIHTKGVGNRKPADTGPTHRFRCGRRESRRGGKHRGARGLVRGRTHRLRQILQVIRRRSPTVCRQRIGSESVLRIFPVQTLDTSRKRAGPPPQRRIACKICRKTRFSVHETSPREQAACKLAACYRLAACGQAARRLAACWARQTRVEHGINPHALHPVGGATYAPARTCP